MDTQRHASANRPLWLIGFSLAAIAICLVMLVIRQHPENAEIAETPRPDQSKHSSSDSTHVPAIARPARNRTYEEASAAAKLQTASVDSDHKSETEVAAVMPVIARDYGPVPPGGLIPISAPDTNTGIITGRVILSGKPPPETPIKMDAVCGSETARPLTTRRYVVSKDGGLADVFVFIRSGLKDQKFPVRPPAIMYESRCQFQPYVLGLMKDQDMIITNADPRLHNLTFLRDSRQILSEAEPSHSQFEWSAGDMLSDMDIYHLRCNVHPWMNAYVCVVGNPFFAVTDSEGNYTITNVPPGDYELDAFHRHNLPNERYERKKITVKNGQLTEADFVVKALSK